MGWNRGKQNWSWAPCPNSKCQGWLPSYKVGRGTRCASCGTAFGSSPTVWQAASISYKHKGQGAKGKDKGRSFERSGGTRRGPVTSGLSAAGIC